MPPARAHFRSLAALVIGAGSGAICVACTALLGLDETALRTPDAGDTEASADAGPAGSDAGALAVEPATLVVRRGAAADLRVSFTRAPGDDAPVQLTVAGLPSGVAAAPVVLAPTASTATISVAAGLFATLGRSTLRVAADRDGVSRECVLLVAGAAGTLDESFDTDGIASVGDALSAARVQALAVTALGAVVVGGVRDASPDGGPPQRAGWLVARIGENGIRDVDFEATLPVLPASGEVSAVGVSASGKIVVVGSSSVDGGVSQLTAMRLLPSGALDTSFGEAGTSRLPEVEATTGARGLAVSIAADESVAIVGSRGALGQEDGLLVRLGANGQADPGFAAGMALVVPDSRLVGVGHVAAGGLVVAGTEKPSALSRLFVARHLADGGIDPAFGTGGSTRLGTTYRASGAAVLPGGDVVLVGGTAGGGDTPFTAALVTATGGAGFTRGFAPSASAAFYGAATAGASSFVAAGHTAAGGGRVARIWSDGGLDEAFGQGGFAVLDPADPDNGFDLTLFAVATMPDGRVVAGGHRSDLGPVVVRLWP